MNTTLRNMMMGLVLTGSLILASPSSAQRRSSSNNNGNSSATRTESRQSVARESRSASSDNRQRSAVTRTESRQSSATRDTRSSSSDNRQRDRVSTGSSSRSSQGMSNGRTRPETGSTVTRRESTTTRGTTGNIGGNNNGGNRPSGNGGNYGNNNGGNRPSGNGGNYGNNNGGNRPGGNGGNYGNNNGGNRPGGNGGNYGNNNGGNRPGNGGNYGNNRPGNGGNYGNNRPGNGGNYGNHRPDNRGGNMRPDGNRGHNAYRDHYSWNYRNNNWSRPLPPPARQHRPAPYRFARPHIPATWRPFHGAPVIDRILGLTFGTLFNASLNYLYTNGYNIDGYDDGVVYLRDVNMLNLNWADVMLCYDEAGRLYNAQFIHSSYYNDRSRYNRLYNDLCAAYGSPVDYDSQGVTWFGGNRVGYVTLSMNCTGNRYYTNLYVGN